MRATRNTYLDTKCIQLSNQALRLASKALRRCHEDKTDSQGLLRPNNLNWVLLLVTQLIATFRSLVLLLANGESYSAEVVNRTFNEALISLMFILNGSGKRTDELFEQWRIDYKIEVYEQLREIARIQEIAVADLIANYPQYEKHVRAYEQLQSHPSFVTEKGLQSLRSEIGKQKDRIRSLIDTNVGEYTDEEYKLIRLIASMYLEEADLKKQGRSQRRWKDISMQEKEAAFFDTPVGQAMLQHSRMIGNAFTHSTGSALSHLMTDLPSGDIVFCTGPKQDRHRSTVLWQRCAWGLLMGVDRVLEAYYVDDALRRSIEKVASIVKEFPLPQARLRQRHAN